LAAARQPEASTAWKARRPEAGPRPAAALPREPAVELMAAPALLRAPEAAAQRVEAVSEPEAQADARQAAVAVQLLLQILQI
jgi:hypothetical protein